MELIFKFVLLFAFCILHQATCVNSTRSKLIASAILHLDNSPIQIGKLIFTQSSDNSFVKIKGELKNLQPHTVYRGFHVHANQTRDNTLNCTTAGDHYNPYAKTHGGIKDSIDNRHVGDLGNIWTDSKGRSKIDIRDKIIRLDPSGQQSVVNRTIVVHKDTDDLGRGGHNDSHTTGHAGARLACGIITLNRRYSRKQG